MQPHSVETNHTFAWFGTGWQCFMANPVTWIVLFVILIVIAVVLQFIPVIGSLAFSLITPALAGGLLYAAREAVEDRPIELGYLFRGLTDETIRTPLLILGVIWLGISILFTIALWMVAGGTMGMGVMTGAMSGEPNAAALGAIGLGIVLVFIVALAFSVVIFALMVYAIPLVIFSDTAPMEAMKSSAHASIINTIPLLVFGIVYVVLAVIAAIPIGLGFLVLGPVTAGALYASYQDIYSVGTN